jgi:hypothetical protein
MLKDALLIAYDRECSTLERGAENVVPHVFSESHMIRIRKLCSTAKRQHVTVLHRRFRLAFLVAALVAIMIAAAVTTIAIVRPQIFYSVRKGLKSWDYTFRQEDPNKLAGEFVCKKPVVPEGYEIVEENKDKATKLYTIFYQNKNGRYIYYDQAGVDETFDMSLTDAFTNEESVKINGHTGTLYTEDDMNYVLWNDGYYIYIIGGDCSRSVVMEMARSIK